MSSEGKLFAPKPIRRNVTLPPLKYSKSIGCPAKSPNNDLIFNSKISEFTNEMLEMASNSFYPDDNLLKNTEIQVAAKKNFISYEEFESSINADISNQSATSEILAILSNSKKSKFDCDHINGNKNSNRNNSPFNYVKFNFNDNYTDDNYNDNYNKIQTNCKKNEFSVQDSEKNYKLRLNNENTINSSNAKTAENPRVRNNFLINTKNNVPAYKNSNNFNKDTQTFSSFSKTEDRNEEMNIFDNILKCFDNAEKENDSKKNLFSNVQQPKLNLINAIINNKYQKVKDSIISPIAAEKASELFQVENENKSNKKLLFTEEESKKIQINSFECAANNILYFLDQNFFLELEKENLRESSFNFASSLDNSFGKYDCYNTQQLRRTTSNPVPIRCTNPFEKSFNVEGCNNKIHKIFAEEIVKNRMQLNSEDIRRFNSKPDFIENFFFSESQTLKVRK